MPAMRIAITGSTGLIGSAVVADQRARGNTVTRLVRGQPAGPDEVGWDPGRGEVDLAGLSGTDAIVHLAAAPLAGPRWTAEYKQEIERSRVGGTETIARACARLDPPPRTLVSASAIGWYGDTADRVVDESEPAGSGFVARLVRDWEQATGPAREAGVRVVTLRTGVVIAANGGLLAQPVPLPGGPRVSLLQLFRAGLGGRLGSGRQWMTWVSIVDAVHAIAELIADERLAGPVNVTAPHAVRNSDFTTTLARMLHRPALLPVPAFALRVVAGDFASEALASQRVTPRKLLDAGFTFLHPTIELALAAALAS